MSRGVSPHATRRSGRLRGARHVFALRAMPLRDGIPWPDNGNLHQPVQFSAKITYDQHSCVQSYYYCSFSCFFTKIFSIAVSFRMTSFAPREATATAEQTEAVSIFSNTKCHVLPESSASWPTSARHSVSSVYSVDKCRTIGVHRCPFVVQPSFGCGQRPLQVHSWFNHH